MTASLLKHLTNDVNAFSLSQSLFRKGTVVEKGAATPGLIRQSAASRAPRAGLEA